MAHVPQTSSDVNFDLRTSRGGFAGAIFGFVSEDAS